MVNDYDHGGMGRGVNLRKALGMMDILAREGIRNRAYCLVLTDSCLLLITERVCEKVLPGAFGYALIHTREHAHPTDEQLDRLVEGVDSVVIPYERLRRVTIASGFSTVTMRMGYKLELEYLDSSDKRRRVKADIVPPDLQAVAGHGSGAARGAATRAYAMEAEGLLRRSLVDKQGVVYESSL